MDMEAIRKHLESLVDEMKDVKEDTFGRQDRAQDEMKNDQKSMSEENLSIMEDRIEDL